MNYPKINIITENTEYYEALYLCFLAKSIASGHFQKGNFYVVPRLIKSNPNAVYFPGFKYSKSFWRAITNNPNNNLSDLYPKDCVREIEKLISKKTTIDSEIVTKISENWQKIEKSLFKDLSQFLNFGKELSKLSEINILITPYGTRSSFYVTKYAKENTATITSRTDFPAGNIAKSIIHILYILKNKKGGEIGESKFVERMAIIDFLFKESVFAKYYKSYSPSQKQEISGINKLVKENNSYLNKLGFPVREILKLQKGHIFLEDSQVNKHFTRQEEAVLLDLIRSKGAILTNDKIADILWKDKADEKYSLAAIAKVIQNIRDKLRMLGINKNLIYTVRGNGYFLS